MIIFHDFISYKYFFIKPFPAPIKPYGIMTSIFLEFKVINPPPHVLSKVVRCHIVYYIIYCILAKIKLDF